RGLIARMHLQLGCAGAIETPPEQPEVDQTLARSLCDDNAKQVFGYLKGESDAQLFYWFFESRRGPKDSPTIIFFQGGPGASSMYSLSSGNGGPCILDPTGTQTTLNDLTALKAFFTKYPVYNSRVFLMGQSFAGHYVPVLAEQGQGSGLNIKGIILGNAVASPVIQFSSMPDMACNGETTPIVLSKNK
ncbi:hypothetical protein FOL47_001938, partial [Perkinsus chesapeaki]